MDRVVNHDEAASLLGAYALHAVDPDEAAAIEAHLATCERCRAELAEHHRVAALLANTGDDAPAHVWDRIASELQRDNDSSQVRPVPPLPAMSLPRRHQRTMSHHAWSRRTMAVLAVAAAVAIAILSVQVGRLDHRVSQLSTASQHTGLARSLQAALSDPHAHRITLDTARARHHTAAELVVLPSGAAYLTASHLPALPPSKTYQLWAINGSRAVSISLLGRRPTTVPFTVTSAAAADAYGITVEPAGGVTAPTAAPIAQSDS